MRINGKRFQSAVLTGELVTREQLPMTANEREERIRVYTSRFDRGEDIWTGDITEESYAAHSFNWSAGFDADDARRLQD